MNILIYANCQQKSLQVVLSLLLVGRSKIWGIDTNHPQSAQQLQQVAQSGERMDLVISNMGADEVRKYFPAERIVEIPSIYFGGFHPDVVYFASRNAPEKPLFFKNNPTVSALALWGLLKELPHQKIIELYREEVFEALGYMDYFDVSCGAIRESFVRHELNEDYIERFIAGREVFVHGPLHPRVEVIVSLCLALLGKLNIRPAYDYDELYRQIPDPLQMEYAWGCFPPLAKRLGVPGSWLIRHHNDLFPSLDFYLQGLGAHLHALSLDKVQFLQRDKERFDEFHKIDAVLGDFL